jgi:hypothetical protein
LTDEEASTELSDEIPGLVSTDEEEEDFYVYSGDKDDKGKKNREVVITGQGKGTVPPNVTPLLARKAIEEEEDLYGYSGDEEDNGKKNRKVAIARRGSDKPRTVESPMELSFEDNLADMPYSYGGESSEVNDSNSGPPHCTGVASADQVGEGEPEVTLISADDIASEGDLAFSPQFFIPESTPDSISSYNYSPINMQANEEVGEILGSNLLNRGEAMEVDADLYREVMMNVEGQAVMETINPILLLPDLPISNPDPVECEDSPPSKEDSPLSDMSDREFFELEQEILNPKPSYSEEAPGEVVGSGQDAGEPEVIMISSDDSSSVSGDDSYCEASPITSAYKAGQIAEREAIIISPNADSSSEGGPTPPKKTDFIARPLNSPVAEVLHDITGTRLFTVDINTILTVISPYSRPEPYL